MPEPAARWIGAAAILAAVFAVPAFVEAGIAKDHLTGRWLKATADSCAARYPAELLLRPGGIYEAPGGPEAGALWHSGEWRLEGGDFVIQMANDAMRRYRLAAGGDELAVTDDEGCRIVYRRAAD